MTILATLKRVYIQNRHFWLKWWCFKEDIYYFSYCCYIFKKALSHWLHWYAFSAVCVFMWLLRLIFFENALSHRLHLHGLSSVGVFRCLLRWPVSGVGLSHLMYWCGSSPGCELRWLIRLHFFEPARSHLLHWFGFSQECVLRCLITLYGLCKTLSFYKFGHSQYISCFLSKIVQLKVMFYSRDVIILKKRVIIN